jgi:hypothetical protein
MKSTHTMRCDNCTISITIDETLPDVEILAGPSPRALAMVDVSERMHIQRVGNNRRVPFQPNHGAPIVTHSVPKAQRPTGKQIRAARAVQRKAKRAATAEKPQS